MDNITQDLSLLPETTAAADLLGRLKAALRLNTAAVARKLGTSLITVERWERGDAKPSTAQVQTMRSLLGDIPLAERMTLTTAFASHGASRARSKQQSIDFEHDAAHLRRSMRPAPPILSRLKASRHVGSSPQSFSHLVDPTRQPAVTPQEPMQGGISAGKNTYTYDAHTYHTKVPPQGIAEFIRHYLPDGGLVLDPFGGSGMTGVAARICGSDVILNELSPAAAFICHNFTEKVSPHEFASAYKELKAATAETRKRLYTTTCRECHKPTEIQYTVWSYSVLCPCCEHEFVLWDHCRKYGNNVKEHKILSEFQCPHCGQEIKKRNLKRTTEKPVMLGYRCCSGKQVEHPLLAEDLELISNIASTDLSNEIFFPRNIIPEGVNLSQPRRHGITSIDKFYTRRALEAMSNIWMEIHRFEDIRIASALAFAFTSLYQRVTRLSEFRFWGGSGNTAHFNVPFISNEANVFATLDRKAKSILDHFETTASEYHGEKAVICGSATDLKEIPDQIIDFIFTDPPFGANINYSEMNILWESWLGEFTDPVSEAIMSKSQKKTLQDYQELMTESFRECYRVLRPGHWMVVVFMNSSGAVWQSLRDAVVTAGFSPERIDIFDKQHGTFKQFVSDNTVGCDLVLHCQRGIVGASSDEPAGAVVSSSTSVTIFIKTRLGAIPTTVFLHVQRESEIDFRQMYSEWLSYAIIRGHQLIDFPGFKKLFLIASDSNNVD